MHALTLSSAHLRAVSSTSKVPGSHWISETCGNPTMRWSLPGNRLIFTTLDLTRMHSIYRPTVVELCFSRVRLIQICRFLQKATSDASRSIYRAIQHPEKAMNPPENAIFRSHVASTRKSCGDLRVCQISDERSVLGSSSAESLARFPRLCLGEFAYLIAKIVLAGGFAWFIYQIKS
jgi:hypothetical protein